MGRQRVFRGVPSDLREHRRPGRGLGPVLATLLRERRRVLLSIVVVALGAGYLAGSLSLLGRVGAGLSTLSGKGTERADLVIEGSIAVDSPLEQVRRLVPDSLREPVARIEGVMAVVPRVDDLAIVLDRDGEPLVGLGITEQPTGANWPEVEALNPYEFVGEGRAPSGPDEVVLDQQTAEAARVGVGDRVMIATKTLPQSYEIVGIVTLGDEPLPNGSSLALFETETARALFDRGSDDNWIGIQLAPDADRGRVEEQIRLLLPPGAELSDRETFELHRETGLAKSFNLIRYLLIGFAALAVAVSAFTVANSNALVFARRRQGFALLRLIGASSRQLAAAAVIEAGAVGVVAVAIGVPLGLVIGAGIEAALDQLGTAIPLAGPAITPGVVLATLVVGVGVTTLTALLPARDASRVAPIVALTRSDAEPPGRLPPWVAPTVALGVGAVVGAGIGLAAVGGGGLGTGALIGALAGLFLVVVPRLLAAVVAVSTQLLVGRTAAIRSLAALGSRRARSRAAATTAALAVATLVVSGLSTLSASFVASIDSQVSETLRADLVVDSGTFTRGGLPSSLLTEIREVPGVTAVSGIRIGSAIVGTASVRISSMDGDDMFDLVDLDVEAAPDHLDPTQILISRRLAEEQAVGVGNQVPISISTNTKFMTVAGIFDRPFALLGEAVIDTRVLAELTPSSYDLVAMVRLDPGLAADARSEIERIAAASGVDSVHEPEGLISERTEILRGFEQVIRWMLLFSVALAVIGVANTLQLSVNERRRELGLLRAVGGSRAQVVRLVVVEALALSVVGVVAGTILGVGLAWGAVRVLASVGLDQFRMPWGVVGGTAIAAALFGVIGAWLPARRAARSGILDAIGETELDDRYLFRWVRTARPQRPTSAEAPTRAEEPGRAGRFDEPAPAEVPVPPAAEAAAEAATPFEAAAAPFEAAAPPVEEPVAAVEEPVGLFADPAWAEPPGRPREAEASSTLQDRAPTAEGRAEGADAATGDETAVPVEETMARCYHCGNDPGDDERCMVCGAVQIREVPGIFSTAPTVAAPAAPPPPPSITRNVIPSADLWSTGRSSAATPAEEVDEQTVAAAAAAAVRRDIVDAAVVEDDDDEDWLHEALADRRPPPPAGFGPGHEAPPDAAATEPVAGGGPSDDEPWAEEPIDEVEWEEPPRAPADADSAPEPEPEREEPDLSTLASPFARVANEPSEQDSPGAFRPDPDLEEPDTRQGWTAPWAPSPRSPGSSVPTTFGGTATAPAVPDPVEDGTGMVTALGRLSRASQQAGEVAFTVAGALISGDERVLVAVQGWSLGMSTVAVLTTQRIIVVSERRWRPLVEEFWLQPGLSILGRHVDDAASLTIQAGDQVVSLDQIRDVPLAVELANTARTRAAGTGF